MENNGKAPSFPEQLFGSLLGGVACLTMSIGHKTGLYDTLAALSEPATSEEIASKAALNERYVREWLACQVVSGILECSKSDPPRYWLPADRAPFLTRTGGSDNVAFFAQWIALYGSVAPLLVDCFKTGRGLTPDKYHDLYALTAEDSSQNVITRLPDILRVVPGMTEALERGATVADVGCGMGRVLCAMAKLFPSSRFVGYDISPEVVALAQREAAQQDLANVSFVVGDTATLKESSRYDVVFAFDAIHYQRDPAGTMRCVQQALKPDGVFLMVEGMARDRPLKNKELWFAPFFYTWSLHNTLPLSIGAGGSGQGSCWGRGMNEALLKGAGFASTTVHELEADPFNQYYEARKTA